MAYSVTTINPKKFHKSQLQFYLFLIPLSLFMILPLIYIFNHAFKPMSELYAYPPQFFAHQPTNDNFSKLADAASTSDIHISRYIFNSLFVSVSVLLLTVFLCTLGGFALSKMNFKGKKMLLEVNNIALMFVPIAVTIPRYLVVTYIGITNTYMAHILPLLATPVNLFLVKQFIDQVPDSLIEAATIDGASNFVVYRRIVLPLIKPAVATVCILAFQSVWTNVETSNLYVDMESMRTLSFYMNTFASNNSSVAGQGIAAAAALIMIIPNIVLFIVMQSNVMNTMAQSGLK